MKKIKLNISAKQVKLLLKLIVWVSVGLWFICADLPYFNNNIKPVVIKVETFKGQIVARSQIANFNNLIQSDVSFDTAMGWGSDAFLVYDDKNPEIEIYRPKANSCGVFEYMSYAIDWRSNWHTDISVYDTQRHQLVFYPSFNWSCILGILIAITIVGGVLVGIIELLFWAGGKICSYIAKLIKTSKNQLN